MSDRKNLKKLVEKSSKVPSGWKEEAKKRSANVLSRRRARLIALRVLESLDQMKISQSNLADLMKVSRQHISKIVKGEENFSLETIEKLEKALRIELITIHGPGDVVQCFKEEDHYSQKILPSTTSQLIPFRQPMNTSKLEDTSGGIYFVEVDDETRFTFSQEMQAPSICRPIKFSHINRVFSKKNDKTFSCIWINDQVIDKPERFANTKQIIYRQLEKS